MPPRTDHTDLKKMDYNDAMSFLEDTKQYGSRLGLDSIANLMGELGDVQEQIPVIHIGGTNGKGTVGAMLSSVFTLSGSRVGWFNTPDVFSYEEEFRINGEPVGRNALARIFSEVRGACERLTARGLPHPTRFEVETAAAFCWFCEEDCDVAILEVGMGGETDATNIVRHPILTVLTSIGLDHMNTLGGTLQEIARVKAGILKPGCPVVTAPQVPEVMRIIRERCESLGSPLYCADGGIPFREENASCARRAVEVLREWYPGLCANITDDSAAQGIEQTSWAGRYERICPMLSEGAGSYGGGPVVILDGAHNEAAARRLREALDLDFPGRRIFYIMGVLAEKDCEAMIRIMFDGGSRVWTVTPSNPRALPAQELAERIRQQGIDAQACENARDAVCCVLEEAEPDDVIAAFGSLYSLREIRDAFGYEPGEP